MDNKQSLMIVDGMSLLFRGFYATASRGYIMKTRSGLPTNAVYGFIKYLWDAMNTFKPTHLLCCWDMGNKTFRNDLYSEYKANRMAPPPELVPQFELVKDVVASLDIPNVGMEGFEADDCIGTLVRMCSDKIYIQILTGDADSLQLINERTESILMKRGMSHYKVYTPEKLYQEKRLRPRQIIDLKGLMGDASDCYPGVKGIGEKTALKLLYEYDTVDNILANLSSLPKGIRHKIEAHFDMLQLSLQLAEIRCDVPIQLNLADCKITINKQKMQQQFEKLEFHHLFAQIS
ncbi:5'-3' exonuclease [Bacillus chungangensis]|uniref:5'-3' exonuclease n=1 Tax=Bacillus chungangensis TaxID=587633 RepID=A0ABT9WS48_9BACI|nr:5'-3' exonuclease H3TH domain-containing protein [Bacillus chungangensis]MDQ0176125.1 5'-3' exonuclease [Bacillus chungangensis]